jgi:nickel-dependent lactate racemase
MAGSHKTLSEKEVRNWIDENVNFSEYQDKKVLLIIPDTTRTAPLPLLFSALAEKMLPLTSQLDVMVALGTHAPMKESAIKDLIGIDNNCSIEGIEKVRVSNHEWDNPNALMEIGKLSISDVESISNGLLSEEVSVQINKKIQDYDILLVVGPVFPHEVVGFSGGNKYYFPGIAGPELLNFFHWLGALITNVGIIGVKQTPVRDVVNKAAGMIPNTKRCLAFVVSPDASLYGLHYGTPEEAWEGASSLSGEIHIIRKPKPFHTVLSCAPLMYDELWVAGKCMYKLEPVVADGGELIIYAPHMNEISVMHGKYIQEIGYHVRDYFTEQWDQFKHIPRGVLAHSTHVRGTGTFINGVEIPRVRVTLATAVPPEICESINLGYRDPATINIEEYADREDEGILLVRKAGEHLYRLENE